VLRRLRAADSDGTAARVEATVTEAIPHRARQGNRACQGIVRTKGSVRTKAIVRAKGTKEGEGFRLGQGAARGQLGVPPLRAHGGTPQGHTLLQHAHTDAVSSEVCPEMVGCAGKSGAQGMGAS
jgi:hypothetical protein